ncbi:hypothetical protein TaPaz_35 [Acinetobacter phage TaPaz]|nr:hypothetical protein TaPaz_35 [Acinetobacter phage TaPaz]
MKGFIVVVKGVVYELRPYKELRNEWDLIVGGKMVYNSLPISMCLDKFIKLIGD